MEILPLFTHKCSPVPFLSMYIKRLCAVDFFKSVYYTGYYSLLLFLALS
jgi:hypothetical protein